MSLNGLNNNQNLVKAMVNRLQELEDAIWGLLTAMSLTAATGDLLNKLGKIVGEGRQGRSDTDYQAAIALRIRVNRSKGRAVDILACGLLVQTSPLPVYTEGGINTWELLLQNIPAARSILMVIGRAKALGSYGTIVVSTNATPIIVLDDAVSGPLASATLQTDAVSGLPNILMPSGQVPA